MATPAVKLATTRRRLRPATARSASRCCWLASRKACSRAGEVVHLHQLKRCAHRFIRSDGHDAARLASEHIETRHLSAEHFKELFG
jgi:hypothetical protein